jgi:glyoxylase-like metal-dependent hydrolase (beta-lactamase superfamily II)
MVLPRISTNISVYNSEPEANPLHDFLESLSRYEALDASTLVLPSHGKPFGAAPQDPLAHGLHERIRQLREHHQDRLDEVRVACREQPGSGMDMIPVIFKRPLDLHQTTFAIGEAIAHLHALWFDGRLRRHRDAQGVWRFQAND